jgi:hypothetical protein
MRGNSAATSRPTTALFLFFPLLFGGIVGLSKLNVGSWGYGGFLQLFPDTGGLGGDALDLVFVRPDMGRDVTSFVLERPPAVWVHDVINPYPSMSIALQNLYQEVNLQLSL